MMFMGGLFLVLCYTELNKLKDSANKRYQLFLHMVKVLFTMVIFFFSLPMNSLLDLGTFEMNFHKMALLPEIKKIMFRLDFFQERYNL